MICQGLISFDTSFKFEQNHKAGYYKIDLPCGFFYIKDRSEDERNFYPLFFLLDGIKYEKKGLHSGYRQSLESAIEENLDKSTFVGISWDSKSQILTLISGVFGIIPIYYYFVEAKFVVFANSLPTLMSLIPLEYRPLQNKYHIAKYLSMDAKFGNAHQDTFYQNVRLVPPGNSVKISGSGVAVETYLRYNKPSSNSNEELFLAVSDTLKESVITSVGTGNVVGAHLSGGLDSSSICAFAQLAYGTGKLNTFYFDLKTKYADEIVYVEKIAELFKLDHHNVVPSNRILDYEIEYISILGRPGYGVFPNAAHGSVINKAVETGCNVLLSGHDGDSITGFGTYEYFNQFLEKRDIIGLRNALKEFAVIQPMGYLFADWESLSVEQRIRTFEKYWCFRELDRAILKQNTSKIIWLVKHFGLERDEIFGYMRRSFNKATRKYFGQKLPASLLNENLPLNDFSKQKYPYDFYGQYTDDVEGVYLTNSPDVSRDLFTLANSKGISFRFPFFYKPLFELCMSASYETKFGNGIGRNHLRQGLEGILPDEVRLRAGKGSAGAYSRRTVIDLYNQGGGDFLSSSSGVWDYIDKKKFDITWTTLNKSDLSNFNYVTCSRLIYRALSIAIWLSKK
ncbi:asparagine synthase-related protein [Dyadobacter psychrotolerans]|uniref:asparagine synthase (glutamine-hydrolyzing) n=1 Tax=Dyadobacter psychrotolerans TaxID=2541721 RepID=A0A4R5DKC9_9BACT|nr:asparagine synthetase B family protein [Dyadobacter psychrotolerans]TDE11083.1 asparagine synthetase B family protein [Dyadobacter psychrotolerans]